MLDADVQLMLGRTRLALRDSVEAGDPSRRAVALREATDAPDSPWLAQTQVVLAEYLWLSGQRASARTLAEKVRANMASHAQLGRQFTVPLEKLLSLTASERRAAACVLFANPVAPSCAPHPGTAQSAAP
jgi:hypothetical protein